MTETINTVPPTHARAKNQRSIMKWVAIGLTGLIVLAALLVGWNIYRMNYVPSDLDFSTRVVTSQGIYTVSYTPQGGLSAVNQIHSWVLHIETSDGQPVEGAEIQVDGDMPQHGHGLPTRPQVTRAMGNGDYLVEGVKFHMPGWWVMDFNITAGGKTDQVRFNLLLK